MWIYMLSRAAKDEVRQELAYWRTTSFPYRYRARADPFGGWRIEAQRLG